MRDPAHTRSWVLRPTIFLSLWTLVGLAFAGQFYLSSNLLGRSIPWSEAVGYALGDWYVWAVLSIAIVWFARRMSPESGVSWRTGAAHLAAAVVFSCAFAALRSLVAQAHGWLVGEPSGFAEVFRPLLVKTFPFNLLIYGVIVTVSHAIDYYRKYHARTVQALELEKHLTEARLQALLRQLKPHFLFNALNGIASLMYSDVAAADRMLVRLSELLRLAMAHSGAPTAPLRDEIAFLEKYLEIERIRFRDRLSVTFDVPPELLAAHVPSLLLQPIAENAVRHGMEPHARPGSIEILARRSGDELVLEVRDNGAGLPTGVERFDREGIGLSNTRARLAEIYGEAHRFALGRSPTGGLSVTIAVPLELTTGPAVPAVDRTTSASGRDRVILD
ncbi:histidine kinase [Opitutales bacterium ASA1]|uniref:sensor histidine kinase n=1 Tax=Congregicoccus parvus TaxID=3081749 RepID=UPI002B2990DD|nr:histidine kinase [Opitutales bacterium ASA1]